MTIDRPVDYLVSLLDEMRKSPAETEWIEFKHNNQKPDEIGEYISALSNSAVLHGKVNSFMIWGVHNQSHDIVGTTFKPHASKVGAEGLENWLLRLLTPKINFFFYEIEAQGKPVVILEINAGFRHPVQFKNIEYIRVGSYKKLLKEFPEKERALWRIFDFIPFEREIAAENMGSDDVLHLLNYPAYFDLLPSSLPDNKQKILGTLEAEGLIARDIAGRWSITNLGAIMFAKKLSDFRHLGRKTVRVIMYKNENRVETVYEQESNQGYASGFKGLIDFVANLLPENEVIDQALRRKVPVFPVIAVRELVANAIIHQDFHIRGTSPMIEVFSNRMEITNPGLPLVNTDRFLDSPPKSRNEALASFMRRIGVCEERGSGVDKVVFQTEFYQLPAPLFEVTEEHTKVTLFVHRKLKDMGKQDRIRACYLHACLRYVQHDFMSNTSLRQRFGIQDKNSATASRIIRETLEAGHVRPYDEMSSKKFKKYVPWWV